MNFVLTKRAEKSYRTIESYIASEFGGSAAFVFEQKVIDFFKIVRNFPEIGSVEIASKKIFGFQITKQTRVFYRVKNETVIILLFFDVRQHPDKKRL